MNKNNMVMIVALTCLFSCSADYSHLDLEIVLCEGDQIQTPNKSFEMIAGKGLERTFKARGKEIKVEMLPRKKRWYGRKGLYKPSGNKNIHLSVEESTLNFSDIEELQQWLRDQYDIVKGSDKAFHFAKDGLTIRSYFGINPDNKKHAAITADVSQLLINGKKPDLSFDKRAIDREVLYPVENKNCERLF